MEGQKVKEIEQEKKDTYRRGPENTARKSQVRTPNCIGSSSAFPFSLFPVKGRCKGTEGFTGRRARSRELNNKKMTHHPCKLTAVRYKKLPSECQARTAYCKLLSIP